MCVFFVFYSLPIIRFPSYFGFRYESTALFWGRLSDRIGRRPVLLVGVVGIIVSAIAFGLSETFAAMIVARCINGLLNGNAPVIRR